MKTKKISEYYKTDSLTALKNQVIGLGFIVFLLVLLSTKGTSLLGINKESWVLTVINWTSVILALLLARQTFCLRILETRIKDFNTLIESKEQFIPIWIDLYNLKEDYGEIKRGVKDFETGLESEFSLSELVNYVAIWKKTPSIFSRKLKNENVTPNMFIFPNNFNSTRGIARLIGSQKFSELIIKKALQHNVIEIMTEIHNENEFYIRYKNKENVKNK